MDKKVQAMAKKKIHASLVGKSRGAEFARAQELQGKGPSNPKYSHYFKK